MPKLEIPSVASILILLVAGCTSWSDPDKVATKSSDPIVRCVDEPIRKPPPGRTLLWRQNTLFEEIWTRDDTVAFDICSHTLELRRGKPYLDAQIRRMKRVWKPGITFIIEGHAAFDEAIDYADSVRLAQRRAAAVSDYYIAHGIPATWLKTVSFGWTAPYVDGGHPNQSQYSRRTETHRSDRYKMPRLCWCSPGYYFGQVYYLRAVH